MSGHPGEALDGILPPGTQLRLLYHHSTRGAEYWNGVVFSNHVASKPTDVALRVRTHRTLKTCTNPAHMVSEVELTLEELDSQIMPGWALASSKAVAAGSGPSPCVPLPSSASAVPAGDRSAATVDHHAAHPVVTQCTLRASRREEYLSSADRRHRDSQKNAAVAMQAALGRRPQLFTAILNKVIWELGGGAEGASLPSPPELAALLIRRVAALIAAAPKVRKTPS